MAWVALLLPITLLSPGDRAAIDFQANPSAVGQVLEKLSSQTGTHLKASPQIAHEIVFVRVKGVEFADLKTRLADALAAEWKREGEDELLVRTPAMDKKIWSSHVAYRRKLVDVALKEAAKAVEIKFDPRALAVGLTALETTGSDPAAAQRRYQAQEALFAQSPMARLLDRLVLACNADDLAAIGPYERRIFKLEPTAMQRRMDPKKYAEAAATFAVEQKAWVDEAGKVKFVEDDNGRMVSDPRSHIEIGPKLESVSLQFVRGEMTSLLNVNLVSEDNPDFGSRVMMQRSFADPGRRFMNAQMTPPPPNTEDPLVSLSDEGKEFFTSVLDAFTSRTSNPLTPKMRGMILGVATSDPLSWALNDTLSAYAEMKQENVVAAIPDNALNVPFMLARNGPLRVGATMKALEESGTLAITRRDGWAMMTPVDRYEAAIEFTPRGAVAELMKKTMDEGRLDMRSYARYAFQSKRLNRGGIGEWFLAMFDRSILGASDRTDWKALQLYGSFNAAEQQAIDKGARFSYTGLTIEQRKIVDRIVFGNKLSKSAGQYPNIEATDVFPLGIPATCAVAATTQSTPVLVAYSKGSDGRTRPMRSLDVWNLATVEAEVVGNPERMAQYGVTNLVGYAPGANKLISLRIEVAPGAWAQAQITFPDFDFNAVPVAWDKLPDPFPKQIADAIAKVKARKAAQPGKAIPPGNG